MRKVSRIAAVAASASSRGDSLQAQRRQLFASSTTRPLLQQHYGAFNPYKERERMERQMVASAGNGATSSPPAAPNASLNTNTAAPFASYWNWLASNGVEHGPLAVMTDPTTKMRGLYASQDIPEGAIVATIPFRLCLSPSSLPTSTAAHNLNVPSPQYLLEAFNRKALLRRRKRLLRRGRGSVSGISEEEGEEMTTLLEVEHMWIACVIASVKHRSTAAAAAAGAINGRKAADQLPYQSLVEMFPTSTADFSAGVKDSWPLLETNERRDFMRLADNHERMVRKLHKIWKRWIVKTGRDIVEEKEKSGAGVGGNADDATEGYDEDTATEDDDDENDGADMEEDLTASKHTSIFPEGHPLQARSSDDRSSVTVHSRSVTVSEQVSATLMELRWAFRMVLSRATLMPSLCEPSAPDDVGAFLDRCCESDVEEANGETPNVLLSVPSGSSSLGSHNRVHAVPCIIPLVDLINHSTAASAQEKADPASAQSALNGRNKNKQYGMSYRANCEVMTARRVGSDEDTEHVADGMLAYMQHTERARNERAATAAEKTASDDTHDASSNQPSSGSNEPTSSAYVISQPAELEADLIDRGIVVLMAVEPIPKDTPVLLEYDLSDKAVSLLRYGFVQ